MIEIPPNLPLQKGETRWEGSSFDRRIEGDLRDTEGDIANGGTI